MERGLLEVPLLGRNAIGCHSEKKETGLRAYGAIPTSMAKVISEGAETKMETGKKMKEVVSTFRHKGIFSGANGKMIINARGGLS